MERRCLLFPRTLSQTIFAGSHRLNKSYSCDYQLRKEMHAYTTSHMPPAKWRVTFEIWAFRFATFTGKLACEFVRVKYLQYFTISRIFFFFFFYVKLVLIYRKESLYIRDIFFYKIHAFFSPKYQFSTRIKYVSSRVYSLALIINASKFLCSKFRDG